MTVNVQKPMRVARHEVALVRTGPVLQNTARDIITVLRMTVVLHTSRTIVIRSTESHTVNTKS